jgi:hypothetical protein
LQLTGNKIDPIGGRIQNLSSYWVIFIFCCFF